MAWSHPSAACWLGIVQGLYFFLTGVWPLVSMRTFVMVTGPKTDLWLVRTVGVLITLIGAGITLAALQQTLSPAVLVLAIGSAAGLAAVDIIYVSLGTIARIYLIDAIAEILLIVLWLWSLYL